MKPLKLTLLAILCLPSTYAQVGIGTDDPQATLDVNGTLKVREIALTQSITEEQTVLYIDNTVIGDAVVKKVTTEGLADALMDSYVDTSIFAARKTSSLTLLNLTILGDYQPIQLTESDVTAGNFSLIENNGYKVPSDGVYLINYSFTYGNGVQVGILTGGTPRISLVKRTGNTITEIHSKAFAGINLAALISLTLSSADLTGMYELNEGDYIYFTLNRGGVATLDLLGTSKISISIAKISN